MAIRIFRFHIQLSVLVLPLIEVAMAIVALRLISPLVVDGARADNAPYWSAILAYCGVLVLCTGALGLYNPRMREGMRGGALRFGLAAAAIYVGVSLVAWLIPAMTVRPIQLAGAVALSVAVGMVLRLCIALLVGEHRFKRRVLIYGAGQHAQSVADLRRRTDRIGFYIVGYVQAEKDNGIVPEVTLFSPDSDLASLCRDLDVDEIVVAMDDRRGSFPVHELLQCRLAGVDILELMSFLERETGKVQLNVLHPSWMIFSEGFRRGTFRELAGRMLDIGVSLCLLALTWPAMLLVALAIKLESGWHRPVFYRQHRVGLDQGVFELLKFRSMRTDAEADGVERWATTDDSRVTRVGRFIRKTRLDELPQLLNVLRGEMRFVGPRPERPTFVALLSEKIPYYRERHCVPPGITGWAQLCYPYGASESDAAEKLQYDLYYVKNRSMIFDIAILVQTVEVVLLGKGAR